MPRSHRSRSPARRCSYMATSGRQDQEALVADGLEDACGDVFRGQHAVHRGLRRAQAGPLGGHLADLAVARGGQVGAHRLRAQARYAQPLVPVGDRQPLGQPDRGVLGHRVRSRAKLGEQARGGRRDHQVALAPGQHPRQQRAGRVDVALHVDRPDPRPRIVGDLDAAVDDDPGVGAEEIDAPERILGPRDQRLDVILLGHVGRHGQGGMTGRLDGRRGLRRSPAVHVRHHDRPGAPLGEGEAERPADAARAAGDDRDLPVDVHVSGPLPWRARRGRPTRRGRGRRRAGWRTSCAPPRAWPGCTRSATGRRAARSP
jgi:hypothetical protein